MTAFATTVSSPLASGSTIAQVGAAILTALAAAGYPTPTTFTSGNVTIYAYNVAIPSGSRTATFLLRVDTGGSLTGAGTAIQLQVCDSTQYNSGTGVVTGGIGYTNVSNLSGSGTTTSAVITFYSYKSRDSGGIFDNRFNFVNAISSVSARRLKMALPYKITTPNYAGSYNDANHCLAMLLDPNINTIASGKMTGWITTLNPYNGIITAGCTFTNHHTDLVAQLSDTDRQMNAGIVAQYNGTGIFQGTNFAHFGADIAFVHNANLSLLNYSLDLKWQCVSLSTSAGAIMVRVAD